MSRDVAPRLVTGLQPVREAIRVHGPRLARVLVEQGDSPRLAAVSRFARDAGARVEPVRRADLDRLARGAEHQGTACFAPELVITPLAELVERRPSLVLALDGVQDPQNFGAAVRSAVGLGPAAVLWPEHGSAPLTPATFRASAGAIEHATLCRVSSLPNALRDLGELDYQVLGLAPDATEALWSRGLAGPTVIVVGSEHEGLGRGTRRSCTALVQLAPTQAVQSLNASVAAAVALYEIKRSRAITAG